MQQTKSKCFRLILQTLPRNGGTTIPESVYQPKGHENDFCAANESGVIRRAGFYATNPFGQRGLIYQNLLYKFQCSAVDL